MTRCSACSARARKLRAAYVIAGRKIKPGRVCGECARLGWLLVLGEDKPRPTTKRELERKLRGATAVLDAALDLTGAMGRCPAVWRTDTRSERCTLQKNHAGKHVAPWGSGSSADRFVRWFS